MRRLRDGLAPLPLRQATRPADLGQLTRIDGVAGLLVGLLGGLAVATLATTLIASAPSSLPRKLAILKTLGFLRRQISLTIVWHATTVAAIAGSVIGLPLGAAAGRWAWTTAANQLGVVVDPVVPLLAPLLSIPAVVAVANLVVAAPALVAGRTRPGVTLRVE